MCVHPLGTMQYWERFTVKSVNMGLLGRAQTLDWWENSRGFNASSTAPRHQNYPTCQHPGKYDCKLKPWGENIYIWYLWTFRKFIFRWGVGGDTICRMLALQKEIGLGRGWEMKMNGTIWSLDVSVWNWFHSFWPHQWCGCHLNRQVYLPQQSELKLGWASLSCLPIQRWLLLLYVSNAMCRWRRQGRVFLMRCFSPLMTQGADREVCMLLSYPIILNHKNRRFRFTGIYMTSAKSAEDDHACII